MLTGNRQDDAEIIEELRHVDEDDTVEVVGINAGGHEAVTHDLTVARVTADDHTYTVYGIDEDGGMHAVRLVRPDPGSDWDHPKIQNLDTGGVRRVSRVDVDG